MPMREVRLQIDELTDRRQKVYRLSCQPNKDSPRMYFMGTACYWLAYSELKSKFGKMSGILLPAKKDLAFRKNSLLKMADFTCALTDPRVLFSKAKLYVFEDSKQNYALLCEQNGEILRCRRLTASVWEAMKSRHSCVRLLLQASVVRMS